MEVLKQVLGVDVSQKELDVCLGRLNENLEIELYSHRVFRNNKTGFEALKKWVVKNTLSDLPVRIIMEATGVYHQKLAYFMADNNYKVSIVLPNKISNYMRTLEVKTITDKSSSKAIARFGLERNLKDWNKPDETYRSLKQLTRERDQIVEDRAAAKNRLHAEEKEAFPNKSSVRRLKALIAFFSKQEAEIKKEIQAMLNENKAIKEEVNRACTIPGMGQLTAVTILAETNGFELITNQKQITSYAGLDVVEKSSGTSVKRKTKISKKGNKHIRKALHLPSLSAVKYNPIHRAIYARLTEKHGIKMKSLVAIQRKMLQLAYILHKNKTVYDPEYESKKRAVQEVSSLGN